MNSSLRYKFVTLITLLHVNSTMYFVSPTGGAKIRSLSTLDSREMGVCPEGNSEEEKSGDMRREEKRREEKRRWGDKNSKKERRRIEVERTEGEERMREEIELGRQIGRSRER